jgi:hypothetical protein
MTRRNSVFSSARIRSGVSEDSSARKAAGTGMPRLTGLPGSGAEGQDTYAAQVAAVQRGARNEHCANA